MIVEQNPKLFSKYALRLRRMREFLTAECGRREQTRTKKRGAEAPQSEATEAFT